MLLQMNAYLVLDTLVYNVVAMEHTPEGGHRTVQLAAGTASVPSWAHIDRDEDLAWIALTQASADVGRRTTPTGPAPF